MVIGGGALAGVMFLVMVNQPSVYVAMGLIVILGISIVTFDVGLTTMLQLGSDDAEPRACVGSDADRDRGFDARFDFVDQSARRPARSCHLVECRRRTVCPGRVGCFSGATNQAANAPITPSSQPAE